MKDSPRVTVAGADAAEVRAAEDAWIGARRGPVEVRFARIGVGLVEAAMGMHEALAAFGRPGCVVLVGTCGAYAGGRLSVGDVCVPARVCLASGDVAEGRAALLDAETFDLDGALGGALGGAGDLVATTLAISTDDALAASIARATGAAAEHLEAWAVAKVCHAHAIPTAVVLGVANVAGAGARAEWRSNRGMAEAAAGSRVAAWLARGAPGLTR